MREPGDPAEGDAKQMMNPMVTNKRNMLRKAGTQKLDAWVKTRNRAHRGNSQIMMRQPSSVPDAAASKARAMPAHLAHGDRHSHRKHAQRNHDDKIIKIKADDGHWVRAKDPESGDPYWYHEETGEASWQNPNEQQEEEDDGTAAIADRAPASAWERVTDDESQVYYWNRETDETRWDEPPVV